MVGAKAEALTPLAPTGKVFLVGEIWNARLTQPHASVAKGVYVRVERIDGMELIVSEFASDPALTKESS